MSDAEVDRPGGGWSSEPRRPRHRGDDAAQSDHWWRTTRFGTPNAPAGLPR